MKNIFKYTLSFLAMSALMLSCAKEEEHQPGEPEVDGCYGVYFPAQETDLVLDPAEPTTASIAVMRTVTSGSITVPVTVSDTSGLFTVSELRFEDGQSESSIDLTFDKINIGTSYSLNFEITDPQYASKYNSNPIALDFSVLIEKWNSIGKGLWRDDFMTTFYGVDYAEYEVDILENDLNPGFYRVVYPYDAKYPYNEDGDWDTSQTYYFEIHAENPNQVWIPMQKTGMAWSYGNVWMGSYAGYQIVNRGATLAQVASYLGTLKDGVITFPNRSLLIGMENYNDFGLYYANQNDMFRVCLPGAVLTDYTIEAVAGETFDGDIPVDFTFGTDVASAKYAVYEGALSTAAKQKNAEAIADGTETSAQTVPESKAVELSFDKSGVYTLVAVSFDADGKAQESTDVEFGYVAKGDEDNYTVNLNAGLELTSRYAAQGYTKLNSALFYIYGKDLVEVRMGVFEASKLEGQNIGEVVASLPAIDSDALAEVNGDGYSDIVTGLSPLTKYYLVVWGTNGYASDIKLAVVTTEGLPRVDLGTGTFTYNFWWADEDGNPYPDKGLGFKKDPNYVNTYIIEHWGGDVDFTFTYDPTTGKAKVPLTYIGDDHASYGPVYVIEAKDYFDPERYADYGKLVDSYYDASTKTFNFCLAYVVSAGSFGWTVEPFTLDQDVTFTSAAAKAASQPQVSMKNFTFGKSLDFKKALLEKSVTPVGRFAGISAEREVRIANFSAKEIQAAPKSDRFDKSNIISGLRKIEK